jgi:hypothetical protein
MPLLLPAFAADAADNLAQVQSGFSGPREVNYSDIRIVLIILGSIIAVGAAAAIIKKIRKGRSRTGGWSSVTNPMHIWDILSRAVARQAGATLELYSGTHVLNYKGTIDSLESDGTLAVALSETPSADMDFTDLPGVLHLNFRPAPREPMEHYQFATRIQGSRYEKLKDGFRQAKLLVPQPKVITAAQRRSFLRLEPQAPFALDCVLHDVPEDIFPGLDRLAPVAEGPVIDISIGGCQIKLASQGSIKETQRFLGVMTLPEGDVTERADEDDSSGPPTEPKKPVLAILMQLLSQDRDEDPETLKSETVLRMRFLGRYVQDPIQKNWLYRGITPGSMDDLAHWLQAFQRYIIQKRRNLLAADSAAIRPPNMFPSTPPKRPPMRDA